MKRIAAIVASGLLAAAGAACAQDVLRSDSQPDPTTPPPSETITNSTTTQHTDTTTTHTDTTTHDIDSPASSQGTSSVPDNSGMEPNDAVTGESANIPSLDSLDANRDGTVSATEAQGSPDIASVFTQADADKNGSLDRMEYAKAIQLIQG